MIRRLNVLPSAPITRKVPDSESSLALRSLTWSQLANERVLSVVRHELKHFASDQDLPFTLARGVVVMFSWPYARGTRSGRVCSLEIQPNLSDEGRLSPRRMYSEADPP